MTSLSKAAYAGRARSQAPWLPLSPVGWQGRVSGSIVQMALTDVTAGRYASQQTVYASSWFGASTTRRVRNAAFRPSRSTGRPPSSRL